MGCWLTASVSILAISDIMEVVWLQVSPTEEFTFTLFYAVSVQVSYE